MRVLASLLMGIVLNFPLLAMPSEITPCPNKPNCVSSVDKGRSSFIEPLHYRGDVAEVKSRLVKIISGMPRTVIVVNEGNYLHVTFTSRVFGFVDDVEFFINYEQGVIQVRSASRSGKYDFGVNRRRVESIRRLLDD